VQLGGTASVSSMTEDAMFFESNPIRRVVILCDGLSVVLGDVLNLLGNEWGASFAVRFENRA